MCLGCGTAVEDDGTKANIQCPTCRKSIRSRQYEMMESDDVGRFIRYGEDPARRPPQRSQEPRPYDPYWDTGPPPQRDRRNDRPYPARAPLGQEQYWRGEQRPSFFQTFFTDVLRFGLAFWVIAFVIYYFVGHMVALAGAMATVPGPLVDESYVLAVFTPVAFGLLSLSGYVLVGYFFFICMMIIVSTMLTMTEWRPFMRELRQLANMKRIHPRSTPMVLIYLFLIDISLVILYNIIVILTGVFPAGPGDWDFENWQLLFLLANASVYEELVTRVLLIGLPLFIIGSSSGRYRGLRTLIGGTKTFDQPTMVLIVLSSLIFGLAHVIYGWDAFKFPSAFFSGLLFAYLYIEKGLHASIMLHFMIDYFGAILFIGLPQGITLGMMLIEGVLILTAIPIGFYLAVTYGRELLDEVKERYLKDSRRPYNE